MSKPEDYMAEVEQFLKTGVDSDDIKLAQQIEQADKDHRRNQAKDLIEDQVEEDLSNVNFENPSEEDLKEVAELMSKFLGVEIDLTQKKTESVIEKNWRDNFGRNHR